MKKNLLHAAISVLSAAVMAGSMAVGVSAAPDPEFNFDDCVTVLHHDMGQYVDENGEVNHYCRNNLIGTCTVTEDPLVGKFFACGLWYCGYISEEQFWQIVDSVNETGSMQQADREAVEALLSDPDIALDTLLNIWFLDKYEFSAASLGVPYCEPGSPEYEKRVGFLRFLASISLQQQYHADLLYPDCLKNWGSDIYWSEVRLDTSYWHDRYGYELAEETDQAPVLNLPMSAIAFGSGDLNGNGEADMLDAVLLARATGGTYQLSAEARAEADLNADGEVDQADLTLLLQKLAGI